MLGLFYNQDGKEKMNHIPTTTNVLMAIAITLALSIVLLGFTSFVFKTINYFGMKASWTVELHGWMFFIATVVTYIVVRYGFKIEFIAQKVVS